MTQEGKAFVAAVARFCDTALLRSILRFFALEGRQKEACMSLRTGRIPTTPTETTNMRVSELIELLEEQDPDAEVLLAMQESWPFECAIEGVTSREEMLREGSDEEEGEDADEPRLEPGTARNDVFIVEGSQLRYGSKTAWRVVAR